MTLSYNDLFKLCFIIIHTTFNKQTLSWFDNISLYENKKIINNFIMCNLKSNDIYCEITLTVLNDTSFIYCV